MGGSPLHEIGMWRNTQTGRKYMHRPQQNRATSPCSNWVHIEDRSPNWGKWSPWEDQGPGQLMRSKETLASRPQGYGLEKDRIYSHLKVGITQLSRDKYLPPDTKGGRLGTLWRMWLSQGLEIEDASRGRSQTSHFIKGESRMWPLSASSLDLRAMGIAV